MVGKFREFCCLSLLYLMYPPPAGAQDRLVQEYIEIASNAVTSVESQIPEVQAAFSSNPTIGFSNITGGFFSSQQTALREFRASEGSGMQIRLQASFGVYRRF
jgi:hypothetical protein